MNEEEFEQKKREGSILKNVISKKMNERGDIVDKWWERETRN